MRGLGVVGIGRGIADSENALKAERFHAVRVDRRRAAVIALRRLAMQQKEGFDSCLFTDEERKFAHMLEDGGILVGDRWFAKGSSELERAKYYASYCVRQERNRRRRERRRAASGAERPRNVRGHVEIDGESQRNHRELLERSKCLRRATVARCPTPSEVRTAWEYRDSAPAGRLRLGGMLLDLECFVDNSLKVVMERNRPKIEGRAGGIRGWLGENCPELSNRDKTLMRIKAKARNLRQNLGLPDPVPTAVLLDPSVDPSALAELPLQVQPRGEDQSCELVRNRFVWEESEIVVDANGRSFRRNENYWRVRHGAEYCRAVADRIASLQREFAAIVLNGKASFAIENYCAARDKVPSRRVFGGETGNNASYGDEWNGREDWLCWDRRVVRELKWRRKSGREIVAEAILDWIELPYRLTRLYGIDDWGRDLNENEEC